MDRLTKRNDDMRGLPVLVRGRALGPAYFSDERDYKDYADALELLAQYEDAEESGELVRLPCKVGDTVWTNLAWTGWYLRESKKPYVANVVFIGLNDSEKMGGGIINVSYNKGHMMQFTFADIGKTVFLSREEAEKALEVKR